MLFLKKIREKRVNEILKNVNERHLFRRYILLAIGCFVVAFLAVWYCLFWNKRFIYSCK